MDTVTKLTRSVEALKRIRNKEVFCEESFTFGHNTTIAGVTIETLWLVLDSAIEAMESAANDISANKWVSCEDYLPNKDGFYLVYTDEENMFDCYFDSGIDDGSKFGYWKQYFNPSSLGWDGEDWDPIEGVIYWRPCVSPPECDLQDGE